MGLSEVTFFWKTHFFTYQNTCFVLYTFWKYKINELQRTQLISWPTPEFLSHHPSSVRPLLASLLLKATHSLMRQLEAFEHFLLLNRSVPLAARH